ncbi:MAG: hypothetical protein PHV59_01575 [Victivallales bacterium]|nr:hypothetical protein [Victivallales bacterium]
MLITVFSFTVMLVLLYVQIMLGNAALYLPLGIGGIFYISIAFSWRRSIFWALLSGISLDLLYGREFYTAAMAFTAAVLYAVYWLRNHDSRYLPHCLVPGALLALFSVLPAWTSRILYCRGAVDAVIREMLPLTIFAMAVNALLLPLLVMLCDRIGAKIRLPLFAKASKRLREERKL